MRRCGVSATESVWRQQFSQLAEAVKPYTFEADGALWILAECPEGIRDSYGNLLQVGYANGWIK